MCQLIVKCLSSMQMPHNSTVFFDLETTGLGKDTTLIKQFIINPFIDCVIIITFLKIKISLSMLLYWLIMSMNYGS